MDASRRTSEPRAKQRQKTAPMYEVVLDSYQVAGKARKDDAVRSKGSRMNESGVCRSTVCRFHWERSQSQSRAVAVAVAMRCDAMHAAAVCSLGFGFGAKMVQLIDAGGRFKRVAAPWG